MERIFKEDGISWNGLVYLIAVVILTFFVSLATIVAVVSGTYTEFKAEVAAKEAEIIALEKRVLLIEDRNRTIGFTMRDFESQRKALDLQFAEQYIYILKHYARN